MYRKALEGEADGGGLLAYNYISGEHNTGLAQGRPLLARLPGSRLSLANFARALLFSTLSSLRIGMDILTGEEWVRVALLRAHGGLFKTEGVAQRLMAAALKVPVAVMESAGEGGPWGIALLAAYLLREKREETLEAFLAERVFRGARESRVEPEPNDMRGFDRYLERYRAGLAVERAAVEFLR